MSTDSSSNAPTIEMRHARVEGYRTEFMNGVVTMGPFADGQFRLTFFREAAEPLVEHYEAINGSSTEIDTTKPPRAVNAQIFREDLFTVVVSPSVLVKMGEDMQKAGRAALGSV